MIIANDIFENLSEELSTVIGALLNDEAVSQPATLADVREAVLAEVKTTTIPLNRFSSDRIQQLRDEVDALIDEYGDDALAVRFFKPWASAALQRLIDAARDEVGELTLSGVLEATQRGLLADLIAEGEIADDEAQTVIAELQALINQHGTDALAEDFIHEP
jgi:hypothetical protein